MTEAPSTGAPPLPEDDVSSAVPTLKRRCSARIMERKKRQQSSSSVSSDSEVLADESGGKRRRFTDEEKQASSQRSSSSILAATTAVFRSSEPRQPANNATMTAIQVPRRQPNEPWTVAAAAAATTSDSDDAFRSVPTGTRVKVATKLAVLGGSGNSQDARPIHAVQPMDVVVANDDDSNISVGDFGGNLLLHEMILLRRQEQDNATNEEQARHMASEIITTMAVKHASRFLRFHHQQHLRRPTPFSGKSSAESSTLPSDDQSHYQKDGHGSCTFLTRMPRDEALDWVTKAILSVPQPQEDDALQFNQETALQRSARRQAYRRLSDAQKEQLEELQSLKRTDVPQALDILALPPFYEGGNRDPPVKPATVDVGTTPDDDAKTTSGNTLKALQQEKGHSVHATGAKQSMAGASTGLQELSASTAKPTQRLHPQALFGQRPTGNKWLAQSESASSAAASSGPPLRIHEDRQTTTTLKLHDDPTKIIPDAIGVQAPHDRWRGGDASATNRREQPASGATCKTASDQKRCNDATRGKNKQCHAVPDQQRRPSGISIKTSPLVPRPRHDGKPTVRVDGPSAPEISRRSCASAINKELHATTAQQWHHSHSVTVSDSQVSTPHIQSLRRITPESWVLKPEGYCGMAANSLGGTVPVMTGCYFNRLPVSPEMMLSPTSTSLLLQEEMTASPPSSTFWPVSGRDYRERLIASNDDSCQQPALPDFYCPMITAAEAQSVLDCIALAEDELSSAGETSPQSAVAATCTTTSQIPHESSSDTQRRPPKWLYPMAPHQMQASNYNPPPPYQIARGGVSGVQPVDSSHSGATCTAPATRSQAIATEPMHKRV